MIDYEKLNMEEKYEQMKSNVERIISFLLAFNKDFEVETVDSSKYIEDYTYGLEKWIKVGTYKTGEDINKKIFIVINDNGFLRFEVD